MFLNIMLVIAASGVFRFRDDFSTFTVRDEMLISFLPARGFAETLSLPIVPSSLTKVECFLCFD